MIISHRHRFIFIKTEKTAGTSLEIALSKYCGPDDVITPFWDEDEDERRRLGFRTAQNYRVPIRHYSKFDLMRAVYFRSPLEFNTHSGADFIRRHIDPGTWSSYFKFCFERNPWDKAVSWYYWTVRNKEPRPIGEFVQSGLANNIKGFDLYTSRSLIAVDRVYLYEELEAAVVDLCERFGFEDFPELPKAKSRFRDDKRSYREILSAEDRDVIAKAYAREIAHFGYVW